jgi:hypothetical protein
MTKLICYFDGGMQHGSYLIFVDNISPKTILYHHKFDMDGIADSNQAEFTMLLRMLRRLHIHYATPDTEPLSNLFIDIYGDNTLVPKMVGKRVDGIWKGELHTNADFTYLTERIRERLEAFKGFHYYTVKRKEIVAKLGH